MEKVILRDHQAEALRCTKKYLKNHDRGKIIHPTGTGKSILQVAIVNHLKPKRVLQVVPSIELISQMSKDWTRYSDYRIYQNSSREIDNIEHYSTRLMGDKVVVISTYQSLDLIKHNFDIILFDEAHRTTVQEDAMFSYGLYNRNIKAINRLFFTATERFFSDSGDVVSMNDSTLYGDTIHEITFKEAVDRGIIVDFEVIIGVSDQQVKNYTPGVRASISKSLLEDCFNKNIIHHCISYHSTIERAKGFEIDFKGQLFHINGTMNVDKKSRIISNFQKTKQALITNSRALIEGVDLPGIDSVCFVDIKDSLISIQQAIGRAVRVFPGKEKAYVLISILKSDLDNDKKSKRLMSCLQSIKSFRGDELKFHILRSQSSNDKITFNRQQNNASLDRISIQVQAHLMLIDRKLSSSVDLYQDHLQFAIENRLIGSSSWDACKLPHHYVSSSLGYNWPNFFKEVRKALNLTTRYDIQFKSYDDHFQLAITNKIITGNQWHRQWTRESSFFQKPAEKWPSFFEDVKKKIGYKELRTATFEDHIAFAIRKKLTNDKKWTGELMKHPNGKFYGGPNVKWKDFFLTVRKRMGEEEKASYEAHLQYAIKHKLTCNGIWRKHEKSGKYYHQMHDKYPNFFKEVREQLNKK